MIHAKLNLKSLIWKQNIWEYHPFEMKLPVHLVGVWRLESSWFYEFKNSSLCENKHLKLRGNETVCYGWGQVIFCGTPREMDFLLKIEAFLLLGLKKCCFQNKILVEILRTVNEVRERYETNINYKSVNEVSCQTSCRVLRGFGHSAQL